MRYSGQVAGFGGAIVSREGLKQSPVQFRNPRNCSRSRRVSPRVALSGVGDSARMLLTVLRLHRWGIPILRSGSVQRSYRGRELDTRMRAMSRGSYARG